MTHNKIVRMAILHCDTPSQSIKSEFGTFGDMLEKWLRAALATYPEERVRNGVELSITDFDVVERREYPSPEVLLNGVDVVLITGSMYTAHAPEHPFVEPLIAWLRETAQNARFQHIKFLGICFGHQVLAHALGGNSVTGDKGFELALHKIQVTSEGQEWFGGPWASRYPPDTTYMQQMHQDHVPTVPPGFIHCMKTKKYPVQAMIKPHPSSTSESLVAQIIAIQGHPEFTPAFVEKMIDCGAAKAILDEETRLQGLKQLTGKNGEIGEGVGRVGWGVWKLLLTAPSTTS